MMGLIDHEGLATPDKRCVVIASAHVPERIGVLSLERFSGMLRSVSRRFTAQWGPLRPDGPSGAIVKDARGRVFWKDEKGVCKSADGLRDLQVKLSRAHTIDWSDDILTGREIERRLAPVRNQCDQVFGQLEQRIRDVRHYGEVSAPETERDLIESFGAKVGAYNTERGTFVIEANEAALEALQRLGSSFPLRVESLSAFERDQTHVLPSEMSATFLARYRNFLQVATCFPSDLSGPGKDRTGALLAAVDRELGQRSSVRPVTPAHDPGCSP